MDVEALRQSWRQVEVAGAEAAKYFYATLFVIAPETRAMFPTNMQYQEDKLLAALGYIISRLDDGGELTTFARRLGADHRRFHGEDRDGKTVLLSDRHYAWVGQALLRTLERFLGTQWTPELHREWAAAYDAVTNLMLAGAREAKERYPPYWTAVVQEIRLRRADICVFTVRPDYFCNYLPGQSIPIQVPELRTWRYLSPANAPRSDGSIEFHVRATGRFSTYLVRRLRLGDRLLLGLSVGKSLASYDRAPHRPLVLIAGGTGLAPLRAIAQAVQQGVGRSTSLIFGARTPDDLYDDEELSKLAMLQPAIRQGHRDPSDWLRYIPTVEAGWGWTGETGTAVDVALRLASLPEAEILISGPPAMTTAAVAQLTRAGVQPEQILYESFDHAVYPPLAAPPTDRTHQ